MSSCIGKVRFETFTLAARIRHDRRDVGKGEQRHPYHCQRCNGFHLGTRIGKQKDRRREE